jgi:hypothetical protein
MTIQDHIRIGLVLLKRLVEVFVIFPSASIAFLAVPSALDGGSPIHDAVAMAYAWADGAFRNAPAGQVLVSADPPSRDAKLTRPSYAPGVATSATKPIPMQQAVDETTESLTWVYRALVLAGAGLLLAALGPRRFVGWPQAPRLDGAGTQGAKSEGHGHG